MSNWIAYEIPRNITLVFVGGDDHVGPTTKWNYYWLLWFGWKTVVVFEVSEKATQKGYRIGFQPAQSSSSGMAQGSMPPSQAQINTVVFHDRRFRVRIGFEACQFFAVGCNGLNVALTTIARTTKQDPAYQDAPLR